MSVLHRLKRSYLSHDGHTQDANKSSPSGVGVPQLVVIPPLLITSLVRNLGHHFLHLQLHNRMVGVFFTVELSQDLCCLFVSVVGYKPSGLLSLRLVEALTLR